MMKKVEKSDAEWKALLEPEQYQVTRKSGTERAFSGKYWDCEKQGMYECVCCGQALFDASTKFNSGTGWPSFYQPAGDSAVELKSDRKLWMTRTEVLCAGCDAHLGHVFPDGPEPTGQRYCMNSASLNLNETPDQS
jgi:peptide-methionine (R)-S-oxide reductase